jgi:hypothetical protein
MKQDTDPFVYMMANEKLVSMLSTVDQTMQFMVEYHVKPDEEVKKAVKLVIEQMKKWVEK